VTKKEEDSKAKYIASGNNLATLLPAAKKFGMHLLTY